VEDNDDSGVNVCIRLFKFYAVFNVSAILVVINYYWIKL